MGFERIAGSELLLTDATSERRPDHVLDRLEPGPARPRPHAPLHLQQTHGHLPRDTGSDTTRGCLNVSCGVTGTVNVLCDTFFEDTSRTALLQYVFTTWQSANPNFESRLN